MRDSRRSRNGALAVFVLTALAAGAAFAIAIAETEIGETAYALLITGATVLATVAAIAGAVAAVWHRNVRTEAALQRGDDMIGRWRVDAAAWRAFFDLEQTFARQPNVWQNEFQPRREVPAEGAEVTVGTSAVVIDGSVHQLPRRGLPELRKALLRRDAGVLPSVELHLFYPHTLYGERWEPARWATLRFPVAPSAERVATRYVAWCESGRPGEADFFHGRGDGSNADDVSTCSGCGWQTHKYVPRCERCGQGVLSRRWARRFGIVQVVLGLVLVGGMGFALWELTPQLLRLGESPSGVRPWGARLKGLAVLSVLWGVGALGLLSVLYGGWVWKNGRRDMRVMRRLLSAAGVVFAAGVALSLAA